MSAKHRFIEFFSGQSVEVGGALDCRRAEVACQCGDDYVIHRLPGGGGLDLRPFQEVGREFEGEAHMVKFGTSG